MTFDDWIKDILKIEAREITHLTPEEQKKVYFTVSADDLIKLWNAGVENGVSGMQLKITDLEKENEQLTVSYETLKLHDEEEIGMLKSENAELKEALKGKRCNCMTYLNFKDLEKECSKAKELLAKWVELYKPKSETALPTPIQVDTEQFLKGEADESKN